MPPPTQTPTIAAVLDQADLETVVGVVRLPQLILRAGEDSDVFDARVVEICQRATDHAAGILYQAFQTSEIATLFDSDYAVWCDVRDLGAGFCGLYQTELVDPETGTYPFCTQWKRANQTLHDRVKGRPRAIGEAVAGRNRVITNRVQRRPPKSVLGGDRGPF